jgi:hypothetical protein
MLSAQLQIAHGHPPTAKAGCPRPHEVLVNRHLARLFVKNPDYLKPPQTGEVFQSLDEANARMRAWAFFQGFDIVNAGGGTTGHPGMRLVCIHHASKTRNYRGLEDRVERDEEGAIISRRQRDGTTVGQLNCLWHCLVSYKSVGVRGTEPKAFILTYNPPVTEFQGHSHALADDPLIYPLHMQSVDEWQAHAVASRQHRNKIIPYSVSRRILEDEEFGLTITAKEYYNTLRNLRPNHEKNKNMEATLVALDEASFVYTVRYEIDSTLPVQTRKMTQIWFAHPDQLRAARRFCTGFSVIIDGTFNTNSLRLPLIVMCGVLNTGRTFPVSFSFCPSESREAFEFIFESMKANCEGFDPAVVIADWGKGLIAALPNCLPEAFRQGCDWHAVDAMSKWFRDHGYTSQEVDGYKDPLTELHIDGLKDLAWDYVKSATEDELDKKRDFLVSQLKPLHQRYIDEHWRQEERRFVYAYTHYLPNLGSTASQRGEGYHEIIRETCNAQLSIHETINRLASKVSSVVKQLATDEGESLRKYPRHLQLAGDMFERLRVRISIWAARKLEVEWFALTAAIANLEHLGECHCSILLRYGLPCRHHLERAFLISEPIPITLVHPRYWLQGPTEVPREWQPSYPDAEGTEGQWIKARQGQDQAEQEVEFQGQRETESVQLAKIIAELDNDTRHRLELQRRRIEASGQARILQIAQQKLAEQRLPLGEPDAVAKPKGKKRRTGRIETGSEAAARTQKLVERAQKKAEKTATEKAVKAAKKVSEIDKGRGKL